MAETVVEQHVIPQECGWECNNCPYATACKSWHRERARTFVRLAA